MDFMTKAPGVYIEEITSAGPIAGVGTSTAALIGTVAKPPADADLGKPVQVTSWSDYTGRFGAYQNPLLLPYAVRGFFENGGTLAYIVPVKDVKDGNALDTVLDELARVPGVSLVCVPGLVDVGAQKNVIKRCEDPDNAWFAILDGAGAVDSPDPANPVTVVHPDPTNDDLHKQRGDPNGLASEKGYAALYWPWIVISDPTAPASAPQQLLSVPPSGHIAGVMARCDNERGVHKAPANEVLRGPVNLTYPLTDNQQGPLNDLGINALRSFPGRGPLVWGARTLADHDSPWRYVNVRRLVTYIEQSILDGVRWAVFEPNNTALWKALERSITEFLTRVWEAGALFGRTAKEAFYVKIDEELNPATVSELGQVVVEVGVAPTRPAEFIDVRLGLWSGGAQITEG